MLARWPLFSEWVELSANESQGSGHITRLIVNTAIMAWCTMEERERGRERMSAVPDQLT